MAKIFDNWQVVRQLSEGGQAWAYLVKQTNNSGVNDELFVLKRLRKREDPIRIKRFQQEIETGLQLSHPNIVRMVDHNISHDHPYLVTEYCPAGSLGDASIGLYSDLERLRLFLSICRGVGHAHTQGVIHRDLKPHNIFLKNAACPVVGDFGLCLLADQQDRLTQVNEAIGARWYMAPELEDGLNLDVTAAADVYSLGKILYWMFAGTIFSREKHRASQFDLTNKRSDAAIHFIYDLLDGIIVADPNDRKYTDANSVAEVIDKTIDKIEMNAHHIQLSTPQLCGYCATGFYRTLVNESPNTLRTGEYADLEKFGLRGSHRSSWLVLACDYCGNVQLFRPDYAKDNEIWSKSK